MIGIREFFKKISDARAREVMVRTAVRDAIKKHAAAEVPVEHISFRAGIAILGGVSQAARSTIFVKKPAILEEIAQLQGIRAVTDIR
ncbi:MAG: hypothetical protein QOG91_76 [Candidatus Parcubacteria bacterium]|jgi:hypothetical protein|nr:hypothetical protein [Candidatus Parcubacteria bacterium]